MSERFVSYARFQAGMFHPAPGIGTIGECLPAPNKHYTGLVMKESLYGLEVTINGICIIIPWANVKGYAPMESVKDATGAGNLAAAA